MCGQGWYLVPIIVPVNILYPFLKKNLKTVPASPACSPMNYHPGYSLQLTVRLCAALKGTIFGPMRSENRLWKGIFGIRDFTKRRCGIRDLTAPGKRNSLKLGTGCGISICKESEMRDSCKKGAGLQFGLK